MIRILRFDENAETKAKCKEVDVRCDVTDI